MDLLKTSLLKFNNKWGNALSMESIDDDVKLRFTLFDMQMFASNYAKVYTGSVKKNDDSLNVKIQDSDIATIERLHDTLLDERILGLNAILMVKSRKLTTRMYKALNK
jgi:hypothetical protein